MVTSALVLPKVFRDRDFLSVINNYSYLGSLHTQIKPHRLISGVHQDLAGILPHCAANQHAGWSTRTRDRAISDGASSKLEHRGLQPSLFPKSRVVHTIVCLAAVTKTNIKIQKYASTYIVLRLPLPMEGVASNCAFSFPPSHRRVEFSRDSLRALTMWKDASISASHQFQVEANFHQDCSPEFSATRMPFPDPSSLYRPPW